MMYVLNNIERDQPEDMQIRGLRHHWVILAHHTRVDSRVYELLPVIMLLADELVKVKFEGSSRELAKDEQDLYVLWVL